MGTTYGPWVRVEHESLSATIDATLDTLLHGQFTRLFNGNPWTRPSYSTFGSCQISVYGAWCRVWIERGENHPEDEWVRCAAGAGEQYQTAGYYSEITPPVGENPPQGEPGPTQPSWSMRVTFAGLYLKRRLIYTHPDKRQHMHPRDVRLEDGWFIGPDFTATAQVSGPAGTVTATGLPRREWPEYAGLPDEQIPEERWDPRLGVGVAADTWHGMVLDDEPWVARLTVPGWSFDGVRGRLSGGPSGSGIHGGTLLVGDGSELRYEQVLPDIHAVEWYAASVIVHPIPTYRWDLRIEQFEEGETLDPVVDLGYRRVTDTSGATERYTHLASAIPEVLPRPVTEYIPPAARLPVPLAVGDILAPTTIRGEIDEAWALAEGLEVGAEVDLSESVGLIEREHDRYLVIDAPSCRLGVAQEQPTNRTRIGSISYAEPSLYPLAPAPAGWEGPRWRGTGDLEGRQEGADGLRLVLPATLWAEDPDATPGGSLVLELVHRYYERLSAIQQQGVDKDWRWPFMTSRHLEGENAEDLYGWAGASFLAFAVRKPRWAALELVLSIDYSTVRVHDPAYTSGYWRAEEYDWSRLEDTAQYTISVPAAVEGPWFEGAAPAYHEVEVIVDLACADDGRTPHLQIVDRLTLDGLRLGPCPIEDAPAEYVGGGELELFADARGFTLVGDRGHDHTGRFTSSAAHAEGAFIETWDALGGDWQSIQLERDGLWTGSTFPSEPWMNGGPERGVGYIEPLQHSPDYTGEPSMLHYARVLPEVWLLGAGDVARVTLDQEALGDLLGGDGGRLHQHGYLYWLGSGKREEDGGVVPLTAALRVTAWTLAPGTEYVIPVRKILYGEARLLLKAEGGRKRMTPWYLGQAGIEPEWVLWRRETRVDEDGALVGGAGSWAEVERGTVRARLSDLGVWRSPPLLPSRSRWADGGQSGTRSVEYRVEFWAGTERLGEAVLGARTATRRWQSVSSGLAGEVVLGGGNLVRLRSAAHVLTRAGRVWSRQGVATSWRARRATASSGPMLLCDARSDELALLDGPVIRHSRRHGRTWADGLPMSFVREVEAWHETEPRMRWTDAEHSPADRLAMVVGLLGAAVYSLTAYAAVSRVVAPVRVGVLGADKDVRPWLWREASGGWVVGWFEGGQYREFRSVDLDGQAWVETIPRAGVPGGAGVEGTSHWRGRDGSELVAGYDVAARRVRAWWRGGLGGAWELTLLAAVTGPTVPYAYVRRRGELEVGWLDDDERWRVAVARGARAEWSVGDG